MSLHTQDWINIVIASGTCAAAIFSWKSAKVSNKIALRAERQTERISEEEKLRWLLEIMFDAADRIDDVVSNNEGPGEIQSELMKMITSIRHIIELIEMQNISAFNAVMLKKSLWGRLRLSIKNEIKHRYALSLIEPGDDNFFVFPDSEKIYKDLSVHYDFVCAKLVNIVG